MFSRVDWVSSWKGTRSRSDIRRMQPAGDRCLSGPRTRHSCLRPGLRVGNFVVRSWRPGSTGVDQEPRVREGPAPARHVCRRPEQERPRRTRTWVVSSSLVAYAGAAVAGVTASTASFDVVPRLVSRTILSSGRREVHHH
jgi:hypothetical protein